MLIVYHYTDRKDIIYMCLTCKFSPLCTTNYMGTWHRCSSFVSIYSMSLFCVRTGWLVS